MAILILENAYKDLIKSRLPLGKYFQSQGYEVHYACPNPDQKTIHHIPMSRNNLVPLELLKGFVALNKLEAGLSIEKVVSFRFIPNVLNYLASFQNNNIKRVAVITGLGFSFISKNNSLTTIVQKSLIKLFYRIVSNRIQIVAQNPDDLRDLSISNGKVILGSGYHNYLSGYDVLNTDSIRLLFVGRLLKSKGIQTVLDIFDQLSTRKYKVSLTITGTIDQFNPDSITETDLEQLKMKQGVKYLGFVENMNAIYSNCNVLLFPSIYREGIPRVIIEALSHGLTIITTDMPGCRETVHGNGYLMEESDSTEKVLGYLTSLNSSKFLENQKLSRELYKTKFSSEIIYPQYLELLR